MSKTAKWGDTCELTGETTQVLLDDSLIDGGTTANTFTVVVGDANPPVCLALNVAEDDVLDGRGHTRHFPRNYDREL